MTRPPRVVIAAPLYKNARHLPEAIESILGQRFTELRLVLVDDCSPDDTADVARSYARRDSRVTFHRNPRRLGYVNNARRAFELARETCPSSEFFAWASDHDAWHP